MQYENILKAMREERAKSLESQIEAQIQAEVEEHKCGKDCPHCIVTSNSLVEHMIIWTSLAVFVLWGFAMGVHPTLSWETEPFLTGLLGVGVGVTLWFIFLVCLGLCLDTIHNKRLRKALVTEYTKRQAELQFTPAQVQAYLLQQINALEIELLGSDTTFAKTKLELEVRRERAAELVQRLKNRVATRDLAPLQQALSKTEAVLERTVAVQEEMRDFEAKVQAFLKDSRVRVAGLSEQATDINLIREAIALDEDSIGLEAQAEAAMHEVVAGIMERLFHVREDVQARMSYEPLRQIAEDFTVDDMGQEHDLDPMKALAEIEARLKGFNPVEL